MKQTDTPPDRTRLAYLGKLTRQQVDDVISKAVSKIAEAAGDTITPEQRKQREFLAIYTSAQLAIARLDRASSRKLEQYRQAMHPAEPDSYQLLVLCTLAAQAVEIDKTEKIQQQVWDQHRAKLAELGIHLDPPGQLLHLAGKPPENDSQ